MATRKQLEDETKFEAVVRRYVQHVNSRMSVAISRGQSWVRIAPPTADELKLEETNRKRIRFHRVGSLSRIGAYEPGLVELRSGRLSCWLSEFELLSHWVLVIGERDWDPSIEGR